MKNRNLTGNEKKAITSYALIAVWGLVLSGSTAYPFRNYNVINFINFFTMALICLSVTFSVNATLSITPWHE